MSQNLWRTCAAALLAACVAVGIYGMQGVSGQESGASKIKAFGPAQVISGKPRERGLAYGKLHRDGIRRFLDQEIYRPFLGKPASKKEMHQYAAACAEVMREVCPVIAQELEGMAQGSGVSSEEAVLISLHEELFHRVALPGAGHCTAVAVGPAESGNGHAYVGQTWDWMETVAGWASVVEWRRDEGPSVLAYGFPGMWAGAGVNSSGLALCWTSADLGKKSQSPRVGVPSYALLIHLLYQDDLESAVREAERNKHAGWFTFVLGDAKGNLVNIEGSPKRIVVERAKDRLARVDYGSRQMTGTPEGQKVKLHARCEKMYDHLRGTTGKNDLRRLQEYFELPKWGISGGKGTIDMMVFDTTDKVAYVSRGPSYGVAWREIRFSEGK
ncbi:MAG: C45 family peptidase [Gemmataceae bacterium]|nr:C45 family peptidase [Gemmataceae bacterium]